MKAADIMTTKVFTVSSLATIAEAILLMQNYRIRSLVVEPISPDDAYGIITETDIVYNVIARQKDPETIFVCQIMSKPCISVNPDLSLCNVAKLFAETGIEKAPVIQGRLLGMISATDLIMKLKLEQQSTADLISTKIQQEILHSRVVPDPQEQIDLECEIAWDVVEKLQTE